MEFWVFIDWMNIFLLTFFSGYFLFSRKQSLHTRLITLFLLLLALSNLLFILKVYYEVGYINRIKWLRHSDIAIYFLLNPIIYFYTVSLIDTDFKFKKTHLWQLIPFIFFLFLPNLNICLKSLLQVRTLYASKFVSFALPVQTIVYLLAALQKISSYGHRLGISGKLNDKNKVSWLKVVIIGLLIEWLAFNLYNLHFMLISYKIPYLFTSMHILALIINIILIYVGLHFGSVFRITRVLRNYGAELTDEDMNQYLENLKVYMNFEKPYLNPDITLELIAEAVNIKPRILSRIINGKLNKNFKEFVNEYRLEESIAQLKNNKYQAKTILEILYDSGFNSKSTFYNLFEKYTGQSPVQFRKSMLKKDS